MELDFMKGMASILNEVDEMYHNTGNKIITEEQYNVRIEDLKLLEKETGVVFANSPTIKMIDDVANASYIVCDQVVNLPEFISKEELSIPIISEEELIKMLN